jgi:hypothetical protein
MLNCPAGADRLSGFHTDFPLVVGDRSILPEGGEEVDPYPSINEIELRYIESL